MRNLLSVALFLFCTITLGESVSCDGEPKNTEARLRRKLFCGNYDKTVRPVQNHRNKTFVNMKMIVKTFNFQDHDERLEINSWFILSWVDEHLKWDPKEYENIKMVYEPSDTMWMPDISLYNSDLGQNMDSCRTTDCLVYAIGRVVCIPPCNHVGHCDADFKRYPFDRQNCTLTYGSWTSTGEEIDYNISKTTIDSKSHKSNSEWKLLSTKVNKKIGNYSCCPGIEPIDRQISCKTILFFNYNSERQTFPSLKFNFILERHSSSQYAVLIVPLLIMVSLNLAALLIQTVAVERIVLLGLNLMLNFTFIQQLSWHVPQNGDDVPTIVLFVQDSTIITTFLIIFTIFLRWVITMDYRPPAWVDRPIDIISSNKLGQVFMSTKLESKRFDAERTDDSANLVQSQEIQQSDTRSTKPWRLIARSLNLLLFVILIVVYFIMILALLPGSYMAVDETEALQLEAESNKS